MLEVTRRMKGKNEQTSKINGAKYIDGLLLQFHIDRAVALATLSNQLSLYGEPHIVIDAKLGRMEPIHIKTGYSSPLVRCLT